MHPGDNRGGAPFPHVMRRPAGCLSVANGLAGKWGKAHPEVHAGDVETVRGAELLGRQESWLESCQLVTGEAAGE